MVIIHAYNSFGVCSTSREHLHRCRIEMRGRHILATEWYDSWDVKQTSIGGNHIKVISVAGCKGMLKFKETR